MLQLILEMLYLAISIDKPKAKKILLLSLYPLKLLHAHIYSVTVEIC